MRIDVLTLFPEACEPFFSASILGRARSAGLVEIHCHDIRDYTTDAHGRVDDRPYGGGPGMVLSCQPVLDAVEAVERQGSERPARVLLTPRGERFTQATAAELAGQARLLIVAGHYEGFDERIHGMLGAREISIGDFVLSGGEAAAMVLVDAVVRLVPGALGDGDSLKEESFGDRLLEYPHYTRPRDFHGREVPAVLCSGDHAAIAAWRREEAMRLTRERRPDLLNEAISRDD